jgi:hypothetical protein
MVEDGAMRPARAAASGQRRQPVPVWSPDARSGGTWLHGALWLWRRAVESAEIEAIDQVPDIDAQHRLRAEVVREEAGVERREVPRHPQQRAERGEDDPQINAFPMLPAIVLRNGRNGWIRYAKTIP